MNHLGCFLMTLASGWALAGCGPRNTVFLERPELPPGTRSVIAIVVEEDLLRLLGTDLVPGQDDLRIEGGEDTEDAPVFLATYPHRLGVLGLEEGPLREGASLTSRRFPRPQTAYAREGNQLMVVDALPEQVQELRLEMRLPEVTAPARVDGVFTGRDSTCVLMASGSVRCWGSNLSGQLGIERPPLTTEAQTVSGLTRVRSLGVGTESVCAVEWDGRVVCFGEASSGQLGRKDADTRDPPQEVAGIDDAVLLSSGWGHHCALRASGEVVCWGSNPYGQALPGTDIDIFEPAKIDLPAAVALAAGHDYSCAVLATGEVWCWGGSTGSPGTNSSDTKPAPVLGLTEVTEISGGTNHICARRVDESVWCWGGGGWGELGGSTVQAPVPIEIPLSGSLGRLRAGGYSTCVIGDGEAQCLGRSSTEITGEPLRAIPEGVRDIAVGPGWHACWIRGDNVECWGRGTVGQLGSGVLPVRTSPAEVPGIDDAEDVTMGKVVSCVRRRGSTECFGSNRSHFFFDQTAITLPSPTPLALPVVEIAFGAAHNCVRTSTPAGAVYCWGTNTSGQVGVGSTEVTVERPTRVMGAEPSRRLSSAEHTTCSVLEGNELKCWGSNRYYKLGITFDEGDDRKEPTRVEVDDASECVVGDEHACAVVESDRHVACWGENMEGQLGTGSMGVRPLPDEVRSVSGVVELGAGARHTCARLENGTLWCWGRNAEGQVGLSGSPPRIWQPTLIEPFDDVTELGVGFKHTCVLRASGEVWCFGSNDFGQLGVGTFVSSSLPKRVPGLDDAVHVRSGENHTCAVRRSGKVMCWGADGDGQLGLGTETILENPRKVTGLDP